jgi:glycosyltransferase involved in cell wall biosynthesis
MAPSCSGGGNAAPRRILYLHGTSEIGGADVSLVRLVERLDRSRFHPLVALPRAGPLVGALQASGAAVLLLPRMRKLTTRRGRGYLARYLANYPVAVGTLARLVASHRVDLVHTNTIHNLYGLAAARLTGRPHVWHVREIVWQSPLVWRLERALALRSDRVIVTSEAVGAQFRQRDGALPAHVRRVPNGVDLEAFRPGPTNGSVHASLGFPADAPLVGTVCRLDAWKGVDLFLHAAALVHRTVPTARFVVVGGAIEGQEAYAATLEALAARLELAEVVRFAGWRYGPAEMPAVYRALHVLVLPSRRPEPFGLVLLEAMACGRPVVATDHGGPREICLPGETGLLVPPGDADALAAAIAWLLVHPERARAMGEAGRRRVETHYDLTATVRGVEAIYDELLDSASGRVPSGEREEHAPPA